MIETLMTADAIAALLTLTVLEVVLSIDNVVFIAIIAEKLPEAQQHRARQMGIIGALGFRLAMLLGITWIIGLSAPIFSLLEFEFSWRDLILMVGGLFLLWKGTHEIHNSLEGEAKGGAKAQLTFIAAVMQIMVLDVIFSVDTVVTAVGMTDILSVMVIAIVISSMVMLVSSGPLAKFIAAHPTVKMLALSFLLLIGMALVADGLHFHIPRGYVYFAVAFSILVEALNLAAAKRRKAKRDKISG